MMLLSAKNYLLLDHIVLLKLFRNVICLFFETLYNYLCSGPVDDVPKLKCYLTDFTCSFGYFDCVCLQHSNMSIIWIC